MVLRVLNVMLGVALASCASPNPALYTLEPVQGAIRTGAPAVIVVRVAAIPRFLQREEIVRYADHGRVVVAGNDWWSEPLRQMLQRVLSEDLAQRLPASNVLSGESVLGVPPDIDVVVSVTQLDRSPDGQVTLTGFAALRQSGSPDLLEPMRVIVRGSGSSTTEQVNTTSLAVAQAADALAASLSR